MSAIERNNVKETGSGDRLLIFAHGYGCDQNMWRLVTPAFADRYRIVLFDLVGCGKSDLRAYDRTKYGTLHGHARDVLDIIDEVGGGPAVFVGHSVSAMIGLLADVERPASFAAHVMIGPSPCYVNDGDYVGGFARSDIDGLLDTLDSNYLGWASAMAPAIMGAPERPALGQELANSFCATDPEIAKHFARVTFLSDNRRDVAKLKAPTLILQNTDDIIAPVAVGQYLHGAIAGSELRLIDNVGHCPHLSAPDQVVAAMNEFLRS